MSAIGADTALSGTATPERGALLLWMIFTGLSIFAVFLLWRYGLIHLMVASDRTYISSLITVLYLVTCGHCLAPVTVPTASVSSTVGDVLGRHWATQASAPSSRRTHIR